MRNKTRSLVTILFTSVMLLIVCQITAFGTDQPVEVTAGAGEEVSVTVSEDVKTDTEDAVTVKAEGEGSSASVTVNGDVESDENHGVVIEADKGEATAEIKGDIEADEDGIDAEAKNGGTVKVNVDGNVESDEDDGIDAEAEKGSSVNIVVDGDVKAEEESGLDLNVSGGGSIDVVVTGTIEGKEAGIVTNACTPDIEGKASVTAWKIVVNKDKDGKEFVALDKDRNINSEFEKTINYIIRINDPAIISLPGLTKGEYGYTAHEGDKVMVKLDIPDGYKLKHVYCDEDKELEAVKGDDGNWYVVIPKGGGVTLSVDLEIDFHDSDDDDDDSEHDSGSGVRASSPKTGDREEIALWSAVMLAAMGLLIAMFRKRMLNR